MEIIKIKGETVPAKIEFPEWTEEHQIQAKMIHSLMWTRSLSGL